MQAADDALVAILASSTVPGRKPIDHLGVEVRLLQAGVKARRRAWQGREIAL